MYSILTEFIELSLKPYKGIAGVRKYWRRYLYLLNSFCVKNSVLKIVVSKIGAAVNMDLRYGVHVGEALTKRKGMWKKISWNIFPWHSSIIKPNLGMPAVRAKNTKKKGSHFWKILSIVLFKCLM